MTPSGFQKAPAAQGRKTESRAASLAAGFATKIFQEAIELVVGHIGIVAPGNSCLAFVA
jgi:hypothetical protein